MTPARRRRLFRAIIILIVVMGGGFLGRLLLLDPGIPIDQKIAAMIMGRKPGGAKAGTPLVRKAPVATHPSSPDDGETPVKLKFETLGGWKFAEGKTPIPEEVRRRDGKLVEITGFMLPLNENVNITKFIVIQSLWGCCFGQTPAVNHIIVVTMEPGKTVEFCPDMVRVTGRFSVGETREDGYLVSIYRIEGKSVVVR